MLSVLGNKIYIKRGLGGYYSKTDLPLLSAVASSFVLLLSTMILDVLIQHTHLTQLLLNIDFLVNPKLVPTWMEVIIHLSIGLMIYLIFMVLYNISKLLYHLAYLPLLVIFIGMYPFLIAIAQRSFFCI